MTRPGAAFLDMEENMGEPCRENPFSTVATVLSEAPRNPAVLISVLMMTGLASSMVLADLATGPVREAAAAAVVQPAGAFRSPHPVVVAGRS